jgi:hypothetical protein
MVEIKLKLDERALRKVIQQEMTKLGKELQSAADDLRRRHAGRPLPTVRAAIKGTQRSAAARSTTTTSTPWPTLSPAVRKSSFGSASCRRSATSPQVS